MTEKREEYIVDNVIEHKTKLYLLAQKLKDVAEELDKLPDEEKKIVIERVDKKDSWVLKGLYDSLNEYMGW